MTSTNPVVERLVRRATQGPDPLDVYEARACEAAEMLDAAARKLEATPDHDEARTLHAVAQRLATLTAAQSAEALARREVERTSAALAAWRGHRRVFVWRSIALVLWAPLVAGVVAAAWALALAIVALGLFAFIVTYVVCRQSDRVAREVGGAVAGAGLDFAEFARKAGVKAMGPLRCGSRADLAERRAACAAASDVHEDAVLALIRAERGMPYTTVYPLAGFTTEEADRIELGAAVIRREMREREAARAAEHTA